MSLLIVYLQEALRLVELCYTGSNPGYLPRTSLTRVSSSELDRSSAQDEVS